MLGFCVLADTAVGSGPPVATGSAPLIGSVSGPCFLWALGFTFFWDIVDLWIRYRSLRFAPTFAFVLYFIFHLGLSFVACFFLVKSVRVEWLVGLLAAVANEMVLSNTNISFGQASLLPIVEKFRELRGAMEQEIDALKKSGEKTFLKEVAKLPITELEQNVTALLIAEGKQPQEIQAQIDKVRADCGKNQQLLALKLANDFIQLDRLQAEEAVRKHRVPASR